MKSDRWPPEGETAKRPAPGLRGTCVLLLVSSLLASVSSGCAGNVELDRRLAHIAQTIATVEAQGAMRCAPRELAMARSHLEFAELERAQGSPSRFRQHLDIAEDNAQAASVLAPSARCASSLEAAGSSPTASPPAPPLPSP